MTRRRFIADLWNREAQTATLTGEQAAHLARVLRAEPGQVYDIVAGGFLHRAEVLIVTATPGAEQVHLALHEELESEISLSLHLLLAVFKFDHFEWAVEKATELGVARLTPILARRTEKHLSLAAGNRVARWRRIALEASKQSRRTSIPEIADPAPLGALLATVESPNRILLSETEQATTLTTALATAGADRQPPASPLSVERHERISSITGATYALAIGPEGGWTPEEIDLFLAHQWQPVTLGRRILRAETAAIAAIAITAAILEAQPH